MKLYYFSEMPHHEFPGRGGRQVSVAPARVPESLLRPREGGGATTSAISTEYEFADQAGLRRPHDQRAPLDALVRERRRQHDGGGARHAPPGGRRSCCSATSCRSRTIPSGWPSSSPWPTSSPAAACSRASCAASASRPGGPTRTPCTTASASRSATISSSSAGRRRGHSAGKASHYHFRHVNPVVPAAPEAAPADLDSGHREPRDGDLGRAARLHLRAVPGAVRDRARAVRLLPAGRRRGRAHGDAGQPRLPHLRRHGGHEGEGPRGRTALRVAHGPDAARARGVHGSGRHALAGRRPVRAARAAALAGER